MAVHFWIHGTPDGQSIWGEDNSYVANRYIGTTTKTPTLFTIDVISNRTYYTYSHGGNVYAYEGRDGSYFAMTVGFDGQYCKDTEGLYELFSTLFNEKVVGKIIKKEQNNYRFLINNFEGQPAVNDIKIQFDKFLTQFPRSDFENLDNTFTRTNNSISYAISEVDSPQFYEDLKKNGQILISPDNPSKSQQIAQKNAQMQAVQQQCANEINTIKQQYEQKKQQLTQQITQQIKQQHANEMNNVRQQCEQKINDMRKEAQLHTQELREQNDKLLKVNEKLKEQNLYKLLKFNSVITGLLFVALLFGTIKNHQHVNEITNTFATKTESIVKKEAPKKVDRQKSNAQTSQSNQSSYNESLKKIWNSISSLLKIVVFAMIGFIVFVAFVLVIKRRKRINSEKELNYKQKKI